MGSRSDWAGTMEHASAMLERLGVVHEVRVVSAHRTPELLVEYARGAAGRGLRVIIAGAGGAANAIGFALVQAGVSRLTIANRTPAKAEDLKA
ncbi:MAG: AIR carboxylase family protein, partial [Planctomycetota bacterium]